MIVYKFLLSEPDFFDFSLFLFITDFHIM